MILGLFIFCRVEAQEMIKPLQYNPYVSSENAFLSKKKRAALPFLDDFSYQSTTPDASLWVEKQVYINNSMAQSPVSRGIATFDGLNEAGRPYRNSFSAYGYGDSLTTQPMDLTAYTPADSLYLSFFIQPQGNGFAPETQDSLFVFLKNDTNNWDLVWSKEGSTSHPFIPIMIPVKDPAYFHSNFQFRFVNFTSLNSNDDIWNLDYVFLDINRNITDTLVNDVAFSDQPTSILGNYSSMPYRHFLVNPSAELSTEQYLFLRNNSPNTYSIQLHHEARELSAPGLISANNLSPFTLALHSQLQKQNPSYPISYNPPSIYDDVVIENKYFFNSPDPADRRENDTIYENAFFRNYFSYDDGSAELAYFLSPALNMPSKTAIKFTLNQPDSIQGLMVYFAPQAPGAEGKYFSIVLYQSLGISSSNDVILKQQDLYKVRYESGKNAFTTYAFDQAVFLNAGTYYIGITQPANFGSDSIYYGLDVSRNMNINVLSYNINGYWYNSGAQGSLMMRPIVGQSFIPTGSADILKPENENVVLFPNPTHHYFYIKNYEQYLDMELSDYSGKILLKGKISEKVSLENFPKGIYHLKLRTRNNQIVNQKICKQ